MVFSFLEKAASITACQANCVAYYLVSRVGMQLAVGALYAILKPVALSAGSGPGTATYLYVQSASDLGGEQRAAERDTGRLQVLPGGQAGICHWLYIGTEERDGAGAVTSL